ncbi:MAG: hypothetical protein ACE5HV_09470 [Acidobacteriota bacterium]
MSDGSRRPEGRKPGAHGAPHPGAPRNNRPSTLVVDFDGTIAEWSPRGFPDIGEPVEDARYFLELLKSEGWKIIIYSCRNGLVHEAQMARWLQQHRIPYDEINHNPDYPWAAGKPVGDIYLDDRGLQFGGSWQEAYRQVQEFLHLRGRSRLSRQNLPAEKNGDR